MAWYQGTCRITVIGVDADWPQRTVVTVHGSRARLVIPGTVGATQLIDAQSWDLALEHRYDNEWRPNVRAVTSRWETVNGVESQVVRSKDHDWPGRTQERNLVLRIERAGSGRELRHALVDAVPKGGSRLVPGVTVGGDLAPGRAAAAALPAAAARPASSSDGIPASGPVPAARPATAGGTSHPAGRGYPTTSSG
ncbi:hypothetical protein ACODT3_04410 [Streptomyces sp. 4.24]|uniref:hypothetical protein n=1 Tax=Streptomyces tritrimontium TaxID=3406573 RepID=UPI003BB52680